ENDGNLGLPGRVFRQRLPEWIADVEYYSCKEYPRLNDALHYNKTNFGPEVDKVCKALEVYALKADLQWCASKCPCGNLSNIDHGMRDP
ncbi:hypothetical protein IFM89_012049, partial [Coptis chinensis]